MKTLFYWKFSCKIISYLIKITFFNPRICSKISSIKRRCVMKHTIAMKLGQSEPREIKNINIHIFNFRQYQSHWADVWILPVYLNLSHFMLNFFYAQIWCCLFYSYCQQLCSEETVPESPRGSPLHKLQLGKKDFIR